LLLPAGDTAVTCSERSASGTEGRRCLAAVTCRVSLVVGVDSAIDEDATSGLPLVL
jgi:hypothetical protein